MRGLKMVSNGELVMGYKVIVVRSWVVVMGYIRGLLLLCESSLDPET